MRSKRSSSIANPPAHALLQEAPLRGLIAARVPTGITALGRKGHFVVEIRFGDGLACWLPLKTDPLREGLHKSPQAVLGTDVKA